MTIQMVLIKLALAFYVGATALAVAFLFSREEKLSLWMLRLLGIGVLFHLGSFGVRQYLFWQIPENRWFFSINSFFGALSYLALAVTATFFIVEREHRLGILGAFVLPWATIGVGSAVIFADPKLEGLVPALQSYWINIHPIVLMTAYAMFANAFGVGVALLVQEHQIKSRKPTELCYRLPSIEELDTLNYKIIVAAFPVLTVGIIMGGIWAYNAWGRFWGWDAKETWALITALIYAGYLHMRFVKGLRGRKAVYVSMLGFASVVFTFLGVNYLSQLHGYLSGRG
ncbi:MAG: c-type cytochrome biogenesis protein CcsB [Elusimicrobia bacterium]|nr:c-type cytochrome biogenesis protein CcsB [Elusimicrobiota bacterium]MDE2424975.1 c-type cytochrome biogenesis protein CcsB [Elusimicrobiota bacterium]